ncbi:MAG: GntR family transcriptional regulator [Hyphomicrobiaceae bacterium]|nr:GntR family transcriptional regulator [Hyphomicrobiaceae bacterium]
MSARVDLPFNERIYSVLREHIERRRFADGLVLGEAGVARAFNTSRNPASIALKRLCEDGLIQKFEGRGYLVGKNAAPVRADLLEAGLVLPAGIRNGEVTRNAYARIYPDVEHIVASMLSYGRFLLNESALSEEYGVSRAVAHEVLTRLERTGLVVQDSNQRWYAGPLTPELVREHFEVRWILEPVALRQAAPMLDKSELRQKRDRVARLRDGDRSPRLLERIEEELHVELIERCPNSQLLHAVRRSQLPLIATHSTYQNTQEAGEIETMASEHLQILSHLMEGDIERAVLALEQHLKRSVEHNVALRLRLPPLPAEKLPSFMQPA